MRVFDVFENVGLLQGLLLFLFFHADEVDFLADADFPGVHVADGVHLALLKNRRCLCRFF